MAGETPIGYQAPRGTNLAGKSVNTPQGVIKLQGGSSGQPGNAQSPILQNPTQGTQTTTPGAQNPLSNPNATPNPNAQPSTGVQPQNYEDLGKSQEQGDQQRANQTANTDLGLGTDVFNSPTEAYKATIANQRQQNALTERQQQQQLTDNTDNLNKNVSQENSNVQSAANQFQNNQEGFSSASNTADANQVQTAAGAQIARLQASSSLAQQAVQQAQKNLALATTQGNTTLAKQYQADLDSATARAQSADDAHVKAVNDAQNQQFTTIKNLVDNGILAGQTPNQIKQIAAKNGVDADQLQAAANASTAATLKSNEKDAAAQIKSATDNFIQLNAAGVKITPDMIDSVSKATGVQSAYLQSAAAGFNDTYQSIQNDKNLTADQKQVAVDQAKQNLSDQINGFTTAAAQNVRALATMYKTGATPEQIAAFKAGANIPDYSDPLTQAKLGIQQAQAKIDQAHANGGVVTLQDKLDLASKQAELSQYGYSLDSSGNMVQDTQQTGINTTLVPNAPLEGIKVGLNNGSYTIQAPAGKEFQCGAFVNRVWGLASGSEGGMASSGAQKMGLVDSRGIKSTDITDFVSQVKPGMAFVMKIGDGSTDHTGIVKQVFPDGTFTTYEANANGKATTASVGPGTSNVTSRLLNANQVYGFVNPPQGAATATKTSGETAVTTPTDMASYQKFMQTNGLAGLNAGIDSGAIDIGKMPPKVLEEATKVLGADRVKEIQSMGGDSGASTTKLTGEQMDKAAKAVLDGTASPSQYGRLQAQVLARAQQLNTSSAPLDANAIKTSEEARLKNAADFQKAQVNAKSANDIIDGLVTAQKQAMSQNVTGPVEWATEALAGNAGRAAVNAAHGNMGSTAFSDLQAKLPELSSQVGLVASAGNATQKDTMDSILKSIDFNQDPAQFAISMKALKDVMAKKVDEMKASSANVRRGTYDGQAPDTSTPQSFSGYTLPPQGQGTIDSSQHITDSSNL